MKMTDAPQIRIVLDSPTPVYRQIVDQVRTFCVGGELKAGQKLPSVRRLALALGIHFNTVAEAYRTLADEGWLEIARRNGARVIAREAPRSVGRETADSFRRRVMELVAEVQARGLPRGHVVRTLRRVTESLADT